MKMYNPAKLLQLSACSVTFALALLTAQAAFAVDTTPRKPTSSAMAGSSKAQPAGSF